MRTHSRIRLESGDYKDEESRFAAFRSELETGARRVRFLVTGIASVIVLLLLLAWLKP
jgi:hypothetical protein